MPRIQVREVDTRIPHIMYVFIVIFWHISSSIGMNMKSIWAKLCEYVASSKNMVV